MRKSNWFWGLFLLFLAVFIIAVQFGSFSKIGVMTVLATALLLAIAVSNLMKLQYYGIFIPLAFIYMIFEKPLKLPEISGWILILAAILVSISFSLIFPFRKFIKDSHSSRFAISSENVDSNKPYFKTSFSETSKYLHGDSIKSGDFSVSFGSLNVYFDQAQLDNSGAQVYLSCSFGELKVFVPREWNVIDKLQASLGSVEHQQKIAHDENAPCLTLKGNVRFGSIEIIYV